MVIWLIFFLFVQTKPIFAVCLPGPRGARLFCHSCFNLCSVFRKAFNLYLYFLNFLGCQMGSFLSDTFFKSFSSTVNMFISILIQILQQLNFFVISALGNRKKTAKFLMRTFTCRSTFLYGCVAGRGVRLLISVCEYFGSTFAKLDTWSICLEA